MPIDVNLCCRFQASNGETATQSGNFYDACSQLPMPPSGYPEDTRPAAGYPHRWRQVFYDNPSGESSYWIVLQDANGDNVWQKITPDTQSSNGVAKNCCDSQALQISHCGQTFPFSDWDGNRITEIDLTPVIVTYPDGGAPNPAEAQATPIRVEGVPTEDLPILRYAARASDGCITHIATCGVWRQIADLKGAAAPPGFTQVCLSAPITFPLMLNDSTAGLELSGATTTFDIECDEKQVTECPSQAISYGGFNNPNGTPKPDIRFLTELTNTALGATGCTYEIRGDANTATREVFQMQFPQWSPYGGDCLTQDTLRIQLGFDLLTRADNIGVGLLEPNNLVWANVSTITTPAGVIAGTHYINHGDHIEIRTGVAPAMPTGRWEIVFTPQSGLAADEAVDALFWSIGFGGPAEEVIDNMRLTVFANPQQPCFEVTTPNQLAALTNQIDPNGVVWIGDDTQSTICANVPDALLAVYQTAQLVT